MEEKAKELAAKKKWFELLSYWPKLLSKNIRTDFEIVFCL
jgi:hypothetical protein